MNQILISAVYTIPPKAANSVIPLYLISKIQQQNAYGIYKTAFKRTQMIFRASKALLIFVRSESRLMKGNVENAFTDINY
jgi:hypothetical protein